MRDTYKEYRHSRATARPRHLVPREVRRALVRFLRERPRLLAAGGAIVAAFVVLFLVWEWAAFSLIAAKALPTPSSEEVPPAEALRTGWRIISISGAILFSGAFFFGAAGKAWYEALILRIVLDSFSQSQLFAVPVRTRSFKEYAVPLLRWAWIYARETTPSFFRSGREKMRRPRTILGGAAWNAGTYFVVPLLVTERLPLEEALRRSAALFQKQWRGDADPELLSVTPWGEALLMAVVILVIPPTVILPFVAAQGSEYAAGTAAAQWLLSFLLLFLFFMWWLYLASLRHILKALAFCYARYHTVPRGVSERALRELFPPAAAGEER